MARREWYLWRWVARVPGQLLACVAHGRTGPVGGSTDVGDRCEQGKLPEVVGLPPGDLVQEIGLGSAAQRGGGQDGELELVVLPSAECALGQEPLPDPLQRQRLLRGCRGAISFTRTKMSASRASPSSRIRRAVAASRGVGSFLAGIPRP